MSAMEKINGFLAKLPFVKLAGNIPEGIRGKIPVVNLLIPFANHIAVILAAVVLVACLGGGGGGGSGLANTAWEGDIGIPVQLSFGKTDISMVVTADTVFAGISYSKGEVMGEGTYEVSGNTVTMHFTNGRTLTGTVTELILTLPSGKLRKVR